MPNRYTNDSNEYSARPHHIKNTDNESTQYISPCNDAEDTAEIRRILNQQSSSGQQQRQRNGYNGQQYGSTSGRQQYYNPDQRQQQVYGSGQYIENTRYGENTQYNGNAPYGSRPQMRQQTGGYYSSSGDGRYYGNSPQSGQRPPYQQNRDPNGQRRQTNRPQQSRNTPPQLRRNPEPPPKPKKKKRHPVRKIIFRIFMILLILFIIIFGIYSCTALSLIKKMNYSESESRNHVAGALDESYVTSILLIGTDGRTVDDPGRSDTMILLSINSSTKKITLTSLMRDSYVSIPGNGDDKLNHAYAYGGPDLLMDTIEQNFNVRVDDYVMVNFNSFASIIDAVDGIDMEISDSEAQEINTILMAELNEIMGDAVDDDMLSGGGKVHLNGKQALAYARIRHVGNADFERTERQREVITEAVGKLKSFKPSIISSIAQNAIPQITTNMDTMELYLLSLRLPFCLGYDIDQVRIPADGTYWSTTTSSGGDALAFDFDANYEILKEQVFGK